LKKKDGETIATHNKKGVSSTVSSIANATRVCVLFSNANPSCKKEKEKKEHQVNIKFKELMYPMGGIYFEGSG
jgi:hypothetical protein